MTLASFAFILTGVLLNAGAQLLLKAGTNAEPLGLRLAIEPKPPANSPVYAVDTYDHTLPWYLRRTVTMVAYRDELGVAVDWDRSLFVPTVDEFERRWPAHANAYAFIGSGAFDQMAARLPMKVIARDARYVFVRKP